MDIVDFAEHFWDRVIDAATAPKIGYHPEAHRAGEEAGDLKAAEHSFWQRVRGPREAPPPPPVPVDPLQGEIDLLELELNGKKSRLVGIEEEYRPLMLSLQSKQFSGIALLALEQKKRELTPQFEQVNSEIAELTARHRALLDQRRQRDLQATASCGN